MVKTALFSTNEPEKIIQQCRKLIKLGWRLIATRETVKVMQKAGIPAEDVKNFTGVDYKYGVPPTLHPKIEQALTDDCQEPIDLVFDVPYPLTKGNDVGGRTLLALAAKGKRLAINNKEDLKKVVELLEKNSAALDDVRAQLNAKVNFEIAGYFLELTKKHTGQYEGLLGTHKMFCREGENPYQVPCEFFSYDNDDFMGIGRLKQQSGEPMCFTNLADTDSIIITLQKLKQVFLLNCNRVPYIVVASKHGNPCGIGVDWNSQDQAINKALWGNPVGIWGGEVITNFHIDKTGAQILLKSQRRKGLFGNSDWMLDVVIAPKFSSTAISILGKRKQRKLLSNPEISENSEVTEKWHYRFLRGGYLRQKANDYILKLDEVNWTNLSSVDIDSLFITWANSYTSFHGGNEVSLARNSMLIGVGGGPSTVMAAQHAVQWAKAYNHKTKGALFCADAFFPFTDAPKILIKAGCVGGVACAGGKNHNIIQRYFKNKKVKMGFIPEQYRGFCRH